ncbi:uncharacterized protein ANIA_11614 [Aspergillus nidulans FGSC A4]|uniref:Uncharacterized protein n=1 Tax=Emericella nidulans (strain FGSC A4 / ATCC 38163 / CBS 112.46 / NRRL 194 / M139) TaxID=227321 RepID=C8VEG4_EMENI|nr:hypothetical protein [Aspergillus nidulans FGSC A4]CBF80584.1 TPA: hypothetical protein ANIA_11614 [Aspergillus nidulans FGSC A4]
MAMHFRLLLIKAMRKWYRYCWIKAQRSLLKVERLRSGTEPPIMAPI